MLQQLLLVDYFNCSYVNSSSTDSINNSQNYSYSFFRLFVLIMVSCPALLFFSLYSCLLSASVAPIPYSSTETSLAPLSFIQFSPFFQAFHFLLTRYPNNQSSVFITSVMHSTLPLLTAQSRYNTKVVIHTTFISRLC